MPTKTCHCFIKHPTTRNERDMITKGLDRARRTRDSAAITLAMAQLTGSCPANR